MSQERMYQTKYDKSPNVQFEDIAGLDEAKKEAKAAFDDNVQDISGSMLLYGPPGTGKSYFAKAIATYLQSGRNVAFMAVQASDISGQFQGQAIQKIEALFQVAATIAPTVIFIDEIDSLFSNKQIGSRLQDEISKLSKNVYLIGATNVPNTLKSNAWNAFQKKVYIGLPAERARERLLRTVLKTDLEANQYKTLVKLTQGFSGSDMTNALMKVEVQRIKKAQNATYFRVRSRQHLLTLSKRALTPSCA